MTFTDRCAIAAACLPRDDYRASLERLHAEMLAAIAAETERCAALVEGRAGPVRTGAYDALIAAAEVIRAG